MLLKRIKIKFFVIPVISCFNMGMSKETLIVVSKLKKYIKETSGMSTSASVADALSDKVRALCDEAVERAKRDRRKTVMDRDF